MLIIICYIFMLNSSIVMLYIIGYYTSLHMAVCYCCCTCGCFDYTSFLCLAGNSFIRQEAVQMLTSSLQLRTLLTKLLICRYNCGAVGD